MLKRVFIAAMFAAVSACASEQPSSSAAEGAEGAAYDAARAASEAAAAATAAAYQSPAPVAAPPAPEHFYDARDGLVYSYVAAISEDDRKAGKGAGDVVSFSYLGVRNNQHVLARVGANNSIMHYAYCRKPCVIISYSDGSKVGYNEGSIIGSAFADALSGRLRIAEEISPLREPAPSPSLPQSSRPSPAPVYKEPSDDMAPSPQPSGNDEAESQPCAARLNC